MAPDILRMNDRSSAGTLARPGRRQDFHFQKKRKPCQCQAMRVAGFTSTIVVRHSGQMRESQPHST